MHSPADVAIIIPDSVMGFGPSETSENRGGDGTGVGHVATLALCLPDILSCVQ